MQKVRVPVTVDPVKSAGKQLTYDGVVPATALTRMRELLLENCADPTVQLQFAVDEQSINFVHGTAQADVCVACERCNEPMQLSVQAEFWYAPITRRQPAKELPAAYEPIELDEFGELNLHRLIEDELMLAMPVVVKHDEAECSINSQAMQWGEIDDTPAAEDNPFAVLEKLKRK